MGGGGERVGGGGVSAYPWDDGCCFPRAFQGL